ncbi:MAG: hypothetical protein JO051_13275 [Acidobacteriaceae bacterium]|nr:hypothetical protein [Acidobacteriaceae bacterium]
MPDISFFASRQRDKQKHDHIRMEALVQRAKIRTAMFPFIWDRLIQQLNAKLVMYSAQVNRPFQLTSRRLVDGYLLGRKFSFPLVDLAISPVDDLAIKCDYGYRIDSDSPTHNWQRLVSIRVDTNQDTIIKCNGEVFMDDSALADYLLRPLIDPDFDPSSPDYA